jgi:hypothetical protein
LVVGFNFVAADRGQVFLLPPDMPDWLAADHLVWFVIDVVDQLDLSRFRAAVSRASSGLEYPAVASPNDTPMAREGNDHYAVAPEDTILARAGRVLVDRVTGIEPAPSDPEMGSPADDQNDKLQVTAMACRAPTPHHGVDQGPRGGWYAHFPACAAAQRDPETAWESGWGHVVVGRNGSARTHSVSWQ